MAAITSQWWRRLVNAYKVKAGMVCLQCKNCVIRTWALQRWAYDWALYTNLCTFTLLKRSGKREKVGVSAERIFRQSHSSHMLWLVGYKPQTLNVLFRHKIQIKQQNDINDNNKTNRELKCSISETSRHDSFWRLTFTEKIGVKTLRVTVTRWRCLKIPQCPTKQHSGVNHFGRYMKFKI